jgi:ATP-binding cassette, subfamily C, bacterial
MMLPVARPDETRAWVCRELRSRRAEVALTVLAGLLAAAASVIPVYALGVLVDRVRAGAGSGAIVPVTVVIVIAALVGGGVTGLSTALIGRLGGRVLADLREATVGIALRLPANVLDRVGRGDLLSRVGADVGAITKAVTDVLPTMISSFLLGAISLVAMAGIDWRLGLAGAVAVPMYVIALRWYLPRAAPRYALERTAIAERSQLLVESMQGVRTVHAYRLEGRHLRDLGEVSGRARDISVGVFTLFTRFVGRVNRAEFAGLAAIVVTGFLLVRGGSVTVGQTAAAAVLFHRLFNPIGTLLYTFDDLQAAGASLSRLVGVGVLAGPERTVAAAPADASLVLDRVSFSYDPGTPVLTDVSLRVEPAQRVALVGSTGAGKTTAASIAAGLLRPDAGSALIGGVPAADLARSQVAVISQEMHVFAGPLEADLRLAKPDASVAELARALCTAGALDWVEALPEGLGTIVGDGGHPLTAAQAQQIALARLVLLDPPVVVLDEATAEAGSAGARELEEAAAAATEGRTVLVVAHRLTQAAAADRVIVLERGSIVESGSHAELVTAGGRYADLWRVWESRYHETAEVRDR